MIDIKLILKVMKKWINNEFWYKKYFTLYYYSKS